MKFRLNQLEDNVLVVLTPYQSFLVQKFLAEKIYRNSFEKQEEENRITDLKKIKWKKRIQRQIDRARDKIRIIDNHQTALGEIITIFIEAEKTQNSYKKAKKKFDNFFKKGDE